MYVAGIIFYLIGFGLIYTIRHLWRNDPPKPREEASVVAMLACLIALITLFFGIIGVEIAAAFALGIVTSLMSQALTILAQQLVAPVAKSAWQSAVSWWRSRRESNQRAPRTILRQCRKAADKITASMDKAYRKKLKAEFKLMLDELAAAIRHLGDDYPDLQEDRPEGELREVLRLADDLLPGIDSRQAMEELEAEMRASEEAAHKHQVTRARFIERVYGFLISRAKFASDYGSPGLDFPTLMQRLRSLRQLVAEADPMLADHPAEADVLIDEIDGLLRRDRANESLGVADSPPSAAETVVSE